MAYSSAPQPNPLDKVFNIMALVGNGFDMQVLLEYGQSPTTSYPDFYHYLKMKNIDAGNLVLKEMEFALARGEKNWSDIEVCIENLAQSGIPVVTITNSINEIRELFVQFLNLVVTPELLSSLSKDSQNQRWAMTSLSKFLGDIEDEGELKKIPFGRRQSNYDFYNFLFINFNFTPLFDNYIHMDSVQFDPAPHVTVPTNFFFNTNPRKFSAGNWNYSSSSYLEVQVVHPHGHQDIPRSLLFGINGDGKKKNQLTQLEKTYWAQTDQRYGHLFDETSLFIVFGSSFGVTDTWWWNQIVNTLSKAENNECALLIYWWNQDPASKKSHSEIIEIFLRTAGVEVSERPEVSERITVISYSDNDERIWLNTSRNN